MSIVLYRISPLHPLAKYSGPLSLKISKFYGPFVCVGPNELSIVDIEAIQPVLGIDGMKRGPLWVIHSRPGTPPHILAARDWLANFTYDFMGDMVFGGGFDLMKNKSGGGIRKVVEDNMKMVGILEHTSALDQLRKEVESVFPPSEGDPFDAVKLAGMPYLNAVTELRLQPPLPTSLQWCPLEGSGGKWVAGRFIPESTAVYIPAYVLYRDPRYFSPSPDSFIPERWLDNEAKDQEYSMNALAYIPFSFGPANCAGKNLALLETHMVIAMIVQRFDMGFAAGHDPRQWEEELKDYLVIKVGELPVILRTML
ncbi:hypothetical protein ACEPAF_4419 [Sanghuangporus sanghuang]